MVQFDDSYTKAKLGDLHLQEEERLVQTLAPQHGFDYVNLRGYTIDPEALGLIPEETSKQIGAVAFDVHRKDLSVAAKSPADEAVQKMVRELQDQKYDVHLYMCSDASLTHAQTRYADLTNTTAEKRGVFEISAEDIIALTKTIKHKNEIKERLKEIRTANNARRISATLELIFAGALALRASDIHIEPEENAIRLRYRFDGVLHDVADLDNYIYERMMSRLKLLSGMVLNRKVEAQDGRFTFDIGDREIEVRSSVIPGAIGESIVMRLLDPSVASFTMDRIQLNPYIKAVMEQQLKRPNGLIITTGPTGSGKTTALYAFLQEVHTEGTKIITIENPVEYKLDGIVQTQTGDDYTFASGLRAILRQDPDVIMVGEIRDEEVASTAIHAAQTGHLVFSTLHTNSAVGGFPRLIDMGVDPRMIGSSVNIMMAQRLVRLLCNECKIAYSPSAAERELLTHVMSTHPHPIEIPEDLKLYKAAGCAACSQAGFKGRTGIFEAIVVDEAVEEVVIRDPREHVILEAARPQGIPTMVEDGIEKVIKGETSLAELERVVELPHQIASATAPKIAGTQNTPDPDQAFLDHVV